MRRQRRISDILEGIIGMLEVILVLAFFIAVCICGGAENQLTEEAFNRQFWAGGLSALACIGGVGILEVIRYELL